MSPELQRLVVGKGTVCEGIAQVEWCHKKREKHTTFDMQAP